MPPRIKKTRAVIPRQGKPQTPSLFPSRLLIAMLFMTITTRAALQNFGFNCLKAEVTLNQFLTQTISNPDRPVPPQKFIRYFSHHLMQSEVVFSHGVQTQSTKNHIYVRIGNRAYTVICPAEPVKMVQSSECFADDIVRIQGADGRPSFMDANNFIVGVATPIRCQPSNTSVREKILQKIFDHHITRQGSEAVAFAHFKGSTFFDITSLLNENSTKKLVWLEEKSLYRGSILSSAQYLYRKHGMKIQVALISLRAALELTLFIAGLAYGLPLIKSLSLASSSIKKCVDLNTYLAQKRLTQEDKIKKFHRDQLGREPNQDLSKVTSSHLSCIYSALLDLTDRIAQTEYLLNQIARSPSVTPSPKHGRSAGRQPRGSLSSSSSTPPTSRHRNVRNPKRVKITAKGVTFRSNE